MLDGRVLGASQVEYKPFGKPPLKREIQHKWRQFNTSATCACVHIPVARLARHRSLPGRATCPALKPRQAAEHPLSPGSLLYVLYVLYLTRQAAEHPLSPGSLLYVLYVLYLTRQAAEPPLSPSSLLYVLYVLYTLYARNLYYMCYIGHIAHIAHIARNAGRVDVQWLAL